MSFIKLNEYGKTLFHLYRMRIDKIEPFTDDGWDNLTEQQKQDWQEMAESWDDELIPF